ADYYGFCGDGLSPLVFDADGSITDDLFGVGSRNTIAAVASPDCENFTTARITEGSALFNGRYLDGTKTGSNPQLTQAEWDAVARQQLGHYLNLDNAQINLVEAGTSSTSDDAAIATMYPLLINGTQQSTLHLDDQVSISRLYPAPTFATNFGRITGSILLPNG